MCRNIVAVFAGTVVFAVSSVLLGAARTTFHADGMGFAVLHIGLAMLAGGFAVGLIVPKRAYLWCLPIWALYVWLSAYLYVQMPLVWESVAAGGEERTCAVVIGITSLTAVCGGAAIGTHLRANRTTSMRRG